MEIERIVSRIREHYIAQLTSFISNQQQLCARGAAEVKLELGDDSKLFQHLYCADFIKTDDGPEIIELSSEPLTAFKPITASLDTVQLTLNQFSWDNALIEHDASQVSATALSSWFKRWFDLDDDRYEEGRALSEVIHSLIVHPQSLAVDFGTAPEQAFWELLELLKAEGARSIHVRSGADTHE